MRGQTQLSLVWILRGWETVLKLFPNNVNKTKHLPHEKGYQDSLGFWIPDTGFMILWQWNLDSASQSLVGFRIPQTKISWIPEKDVFLYLGWKHIRRVTRHYKQPATTLQIGIYIYIYIYSTISFWEFNVGLLCIFLLIRSSRRSYVLRHIRLRPFAI